MMVYLDNNASAPLRPQAYEAACAALKGGGNASSVHATGRAARKRIETARRQVAGLVNSEPGQVIFTSGGTEANNIAVYSARANDAERLVVSAIEHPSVLEAAKDSGLPVVMIEADENGVIEAQALEAALGEDNSPALISVMLANNESGVIQPIAELASIAHENGHMFHCDSVQAAGRIPVDMAGLGVDMLSLSAHKLGGPQGVGALITASGIEISPVIVGGGQEFSKRSGTENGPGIAGFGAAAQASFDELDKQSHIKSLRDEAEKQILALRPDIHIFGRHADRLGNTSFFAIPGIKADTLMMALDLEGICVSAGAACHSGKTGKSHVPAAMGDGDLAASAIRVSFGWQNNKDDLTRFMDALAAVLERIQTNAAA